MGRRELKRPRKEGGRGAGGWEEKTRGGGRQTDYVTKRTRGLPLFVLCPSPISAARHEFFVSQLVPLFALHPPRPWKLYAGQAQHGNMSLCIRQALPGGPNRTDMQKNTNEEYEGEILISINALNIASKTVLTSIAFRQQGEAQLQASKSRAAILEAHPVCSPQSTRRPRPTPRDPTR